MIYGEKRDYRVFAQKENNLCKSIALAQISECLGFIDVANKLIKVADEMFSIEDAINEYSLPLRYTDDINDIFKNGGIFSIMHPIFNLHKITFWNGIFFNTWLAPVEARLPQQTIRKFLSKHKYHLNGYYVCNNDCKKG